MIDVADKYTKHKKMTRLYYVLRRVGFEIMRFRLTAVHDNLTQISAFFPRHIFQSIERKIWKEFRKEPPTLFCL